MADVANNGAVMLSGMIALVVVETVTELVMVMIIMVKDGENDQGTRSDHARWMVVMV